MQSAHLQSTNIKRKLTSATWLVAIEMPETLLLLLLLFTSLVGAVLHSFNRRQRVQIIRFMWRVLEKCVANLVASDWVEWRFHWIGIKIGKLDDQFDEKVCILSEASGIPQTGIPLDGCFTATKKEIPRSQVAVYSGYSNSNSLSSPEESTGRHWDVAK